MQYKKIVLGNLLITCVAVNKKKKKDTAHWQPPPPRSDPVRRRGRGGASRARQIIPNRNRYFILLPLAMAYICMRFIYT